MLFNYQVVKKYLERSLFNTKKALLIISTGLNIKERIL